MNDGKTQDTGVATDSALTSGSPTDSEILDWLEEHGTMDWMYRHSVRHCVCMHSENAFTEKPNLREAVAAAMANDEMNLSKKRD